MRTTHVGSLSRPPVIIERLRAAEAGAPIELTGGKGVDIVWDPVGGDRILDTMRGLGPLGVRSSSVSPADTFRTCPSIECSLRNLDVVGTYSGG
jgi:NADPH:quinone reductase-like Zn-dependent oxidoreductase